MNLLLRLSPLLLLFSCATTNWQTANKDSAGIAPKPSEEKRAVVQVYAARTYGWRGYFGVHPWISVKEKDGDHYKVYQVIGWRARRGLSVVSIEKDEPDRYWYGSKPNLILDLRGAPAESAIPKIHAAALAYPYQNAYRLWPGPNSNTFVAHVNRSVPELEVELPPNSIGKDWIDDGDLFGKSESGTGFQFSILGALGFTLGLAEGVEVNVLGLTFGIDLWRPALKLPMIGRIGFPDAPVFTRSED